MKDRLEQARNLVRLWLAVAILGTTLSGCVKGSESETLPQRTPVPNPEMEEFMQELLPHLDFSTQKRFQETQIEPLPSIMTSTYVCSEGEPTQVISGCFRKSPFGDPTVYYNSQDGVEILRHEIFHSLVKLPQGIFRVGSTEIQMGPKQKDIKFLAPLSCSPAEAQQRYEGNPQLGPGFTGDLQFCLSSTGSDQPAEHWVEVDGRLTEEILATFFESSTNNLPAYLVNNTSNFMTQENVVTMQSFFGQPEMSAKLINAFNTGDWSIVFRLLGQSYFENQTDLDLNDPETQIALQDLGRNLLLSILTHSDKPESTPIFK